MQSHEYNEAYNEAYNWLLLAKRTSYTPFVQTIERALFRVIIVHQKDETVVAFSGASVLVEHDRSSLFCGGHVHAGMLSLYRSVRDEILCSVYPPNVQKKLFVCGYGIGGAIASLCAIDMSWHYSVNVITFGSPCFACKRFQKIFRNIFPCALSVCNVFDFHVYLPLKYKQAAKVKWVHKVCCSSHLESYF